jgi:prophage maintenance system killer protein
MLWELAKLDWERGMPAFKIRDRSGLEATLAQPYQAVFGRQLYPTVCAKAACLFRGFAKNHVLIDGTSAWPSPRRQRSSS